MLNYSTVIELKKTNGSLVDLPNSEYFFCEDERLDSIGTAVLRAQSLSLLLSIGRVHTYRGTTAKKIKKKCCLSLNEVFGNLKSL